MLRSIQKELNSHLKLVFEWYTCFMEPKDASQAQYIELESPESLARGQDFYDQPPFNDVLQVVSNSSNLPEEVIGYILTRLAKQYRDRSFNAGSPIKDSQELSRKMREYDIHVDDIQAIRGSIRRLRSMRAKLPLKDALQAIQQLGIQLEQFPLWAEYVDANLASGIYRSDGTFYQNCLAKSFAESYASWITHRLQREGILVTYGIHEIFPQDFAAEIPTDVPVDRGSSRENRRWRILKASELIRPKP